MSEMIERVASEILKTRAPKQSREAWAEAAARAVIQAMREPTAAMVRVGVAATNEDSGFDLGRIDDRDARKCYASMIDEALK